MKFTQLWFSFAAVLAFIVYRVSQIRPKVSMKWKLW